MTYTAYLNGEKFFDSSGLYDGYLLTSAEIEMEAGAAGSFVFGIPPGNIAYGGFGKLTDEVIVYRDGEEIFCGRVYGESGELNTVHTVTCEGILAVLNDSIFEPDTYECSLAELVAAIVKNHNSKCPTWPIAVGDLEIEDDYLYREYENYETSKTRLDDLVDSYGGYPEIRHEDDTYYLDWKDYDETIIAGQSIDFGENLIDITQESTADEIITALIPLGATVSEEATATDDDGEETTETTEYTVDISSVNDGLIYIYDEDAVETFGWIWGTYTWDDVEEPENLYTKAVAYLEKMCKSKVTIDVTAVDLALIDETVEHFEIGKLAHVTAAPQGIDEDFLVAKLTLNLLDPSADVLELGSTHEGFVSASTKLYQKNVKIAEKIVANYATNSALSVVAQKVVTNTSLISQNSKAITLLTAQTTQAQEDIILLSAQYTITATSQTLIVSESSGLDDTNLAPDLAEWSSLELGSTSSAAEGKYLTCSMTLPEDGTYYVFITAAGGNMTVAFADSSVTQTLSSEVVTYALIFDDLSAGTYTLAVNYSYGDDGAGDIYDIYVYQKIYSDAYSRLTLLSSSITAEVTRATEAEGELSTLITQTAEDITALIEANDTTMLIRASGDGVEIARLEDDEYTSTKTLIDETGMTVSDASGSTKYLECLSTGINLYAGGAVAQKITSSGISLYTGGTIGHTITASGAVMYANGQQGLTLTSDGIQVYYNGSLGTSIISDASYGTRIQSTSGVDVYAAAGQICIDTAGSGDNGNISIYAQGSGSNVYVSSDSGNINLEATGGSIYATPYSGGSTLYCVPVGADSNSTMIDSGVVSITCTAGDTSTASVSFYNSSIFSSTPRVVVTGATMYASTLSFTVRDRTTTGFTMYAYNSGSTDRTVDVCWIAVGKG